MNPGLLLGYGAYNMSMESKFRPELLSLCKRGFVIGLAHTRGGGEYQNWHRLGKHLNKISSITDFAQCAFELSKCGFVDPKKIGAMGTSAGGFLVASAANLYPGLFQSIVLDVPFVDVLTAMLDQSLALTKSEREEWGDPINSKMDYMNLANLAPYENLSKSTTASWISVGSNDQRVPFWHGLKYVAKQRVLNIETYLHYRNKGHFSTKSDSIREHAIKVTFLLQKILKH
jgi:oligopeptidase B